jgi:hypothetical protein
MRWRDIRFEKPTKKDELDGKIIQKLLNGTLCFWSASNLQACVAWMPVSELPQPDLPVIPDGWRPVDQAVDAHDARAQYWLSGKWRSTCRDDDWDPDRDYIVPIDPPAPQYRPFASAAEFAPHRDRWISRAHSQFQDARGGFRCTAYDDSAIWEHHVQTSYHQLFTAGRKFLNEDGTLAEPVGMKIE